MPAPLLDRAVLDDLAESIGLDGARVVIEVFLPESAAYVATIAEVAGNPEDAAARERARRAAHSLKSGAGQIGAAAMASAAADVERAAAENRPELRAIAMRLEELAARTRDALHAFLG